MKAFWPDIIKKDLALLDLNCESPLHGPSDLNSLLFKQYSLRASESLGTVWLSGRRRQWKFPTAAHILRIERKTLPPCLTHHRREFS